jgi:uncharacterized protein YrrD
MLRSVVDLYRMSISAMDGDIGSVRDAFFDDERWTIRYFVVATGGWLSRRKVLITPSVIRELNLDRDRIEVKLTREQVENSPDIDTDQPVSRQHEKAYFDYYGIGYYWAGPVMGAPAAVVPPIVHEDVKEQHDRELADGDPHLRSVKEVTGYHIRARDGEVGHVEDVLFDDRSWLLRYLVVDTRNWLPGKRVVVAPEWVRDVSWVDRQVVVDLSRDAIRSSPELRDRSFITDEYEASLHSYYARSHAAERARSSGAGPRASA